MYIVIFDFSYILILSFLNSISQNNYDAYYGKDGNIERYIAIEEEGNNLVVNQYDSNDNIVKSEVIPSENGRYKASDIKDTIEKVSNLYDENRPIKGQQDIEGNEVLSMKKEKNTTQKTNIIKSIEKFEKQSIELIEIPLLILQMLLMCIIKITKLLPIKICQHYQVKVQV